MILARLSRAIREQNGFAVVLERSIALAQMPAGAGTASRRDTARSARVISNAKGRAIIARAA